MFVTRRSLIALAVVVGFIMTSGIASETAFARKRHHVRRHHSTARFVIRVGTPVRVRTKAKIAGKIAGAIDFAVKPKDTKLYVDGTLRGTVNDFDGHPQYLWLSPGKHKIVLEPSKGNKVMETIHIQAGAKIKIKLKLE